MSSRATTEASGIADVFPNMDVDDYVFEPCGYSMNGLCGDEYSTVHITPEAGFSYCSVEHSNVPVSVADPEAYARNDTLVCYWVTEADSSNAEVDSPWTVVDDDPEDPVFYSTCYQKQSSWEFVGNPACPACEKPQVGSTRWKYGERCVSCAAAEHYAYISSYNLTVAPWWEFTDDCENCDRR